MELVVWGAGFAKMNHGSGSFDLVWPEPGHGGSGTCRWITMQRNLTNSPFRRLDSVHTPVLLINQRYGQTHLFERTELMFNRTPTVIHIENPRATAKAGLCG